MLRSSNKSLVASSSSFFKSKFIISSSSSFICRNQHTVASASASATVALTAVADRYSYYHHTTRTTTTTTTTTPSFSNTKKQQQQHHQQKRFFLNMNHQQQQQEDNDNKKKKETSQALTLEEQERQRKEQELEQELEAERELFDSLFSTRRPKDGWAGLSSGLKSVAKGTAAGVAALIAAPIAGAQQDGTKGFMVGLATGVASAVALPVTGVCVGAYQVGRGLVNSAEAVKCAQAGMLWDEDKREWYFYSIEKEAEEIQKLLLQQQQEAYASSSSQQSSSSFGAGGATERKVKDREYYNLLGVSTNATNASLKKAYYKRSRQVHPDRNPNDPEAAQKFQALSHAYQTLSNEHARAFYDKHGKQESSSSSDAIELSLTDIDPYVFFAVMFGSDSVRPYIGELWIANKADALLKDPALQEKFANATTTTNGDEDNDTNIDESVLREHATKQEQHEALKQRQRQVECAQFLRQRIAPYVNDEIDEAEYIATIQEEAATITKSTFGDVFLSAIGFCLEVEAMDFLGSHKSFLGMEGQAAKFKKRSYTLSNQMRLLGAGLSAARAGSQAYQEMEKLQQEQLQQQQQQRNLEQEQQATSSSSRSTGGTEANSTTGNDNSNTAMDHERVKKATEKIEASLPAVLELALAINVQDITRTLKHVCNKVFYDDAETVPLEDRLKRAEGVLLLGREFSNFAKLAKKTNFKNINAQELRTRAEVAAMTTLAKAQGQEVSDKDAEEMIRQHRAMEEEHLAAKQQQQQQQQR